ncbi:MAG: hypothetical protein LUC98_13150 [Lachnospiraceae bacterium]|nr:hypothetical protein [Lachnospiraceae bacterium]
MVPLKLSLKLLVLPMAVIVTVLQWFGIFLTSFVGGFLYIFSGVCFLAAVLGFLMNICTGPEAVKLLTTGFVAFVFPVVAGWLIGKIAVLKCILWDFIKS